MYSFNSLLSLTLKDIVLLLSKCLTGPIISGDFVNNDRMTSSSLYPMKFLDGFFVPYDSLFETNISLTSMSSIVNSFLSL